MRHFWIILPVLLLFADPVSAEDTIKLGASLPLTGEIASYGDDLKNGIALAAEDINAKGGILGKKLEPLFEDDGADPKTAVAVADRFLGKKIAGAVNAVSRSSLAVAPIYAEENIPFFNLASTDIITEHGWGNVIRTIPKNGQEAPKIAALIEQKATGKKLAVLYDSEEYSSNLTEGVLAILEHNGKIKPQLTYKASGKDADYSALISKLKDQKIDVVFLGFWPKTTGLILRQAATADYHPVFISDATSSMDELPKIAGSQADGLLFPMYPDPRLNKAAQPVLKELAERHIVNRPFAVYGYLLVQIFAEAATKAGSTDSTKIMQTLKANSFDTIMGPVHFTANGDMQGIDFDTYTWKFGETVPVKQP